MRVVVGVAVAVVVLVLMRMAMVVVVGVPVVVRVGVPVVVVPQDHHHQHIHPHANDGDDEHDCSEGARGAGREAGGTGQGLAVWCAGGQRHGAAEPMACRHCERSSSVQRVYVPHQRWQPRLPSLTTICTLLHQRQVHARIGPNLPSPATLQFF